MLPSLKCNSKSLISITLIRPSVKAHSATNNHSRSRIRKSRRCLSTLILSRNSWDDGSRRAYAGTLSYDIKLKLNFPSTYNDGFWRSTHRRGMGVRSALSTTLLHRRINTASFDVVRQIKKFQRSISIALSWRVRIWNLRKNCSYCSYSKRDASVAKWCFGSAISIAHFTIQTTKLADGLLIPKRWSRSNSITPDNK